jgi:hypothetical protein
MDRFEKFGVPVLLGFLVLAVFVKIWQVVDLKPHNGVVVSHNVTSNRRGQAHYNTLVSCDDGYIRQVEDMKTYIVPIGNRVTIYTFQ